MLTKITPYIISLLLFACSSISVLAQDSGAQATASPDPRQVELEKEIAREKLRTSLAEQRKRTLALMLPPGTTEPGLKGDVTIEDKANAFEVERTALSYEALSIIAKNITSKLQRGAGNFNQVVIYSDDFHTLIQYRVFKSQAVPALGAYEFLLATDKAKQDAARGQSRGLASEILQAPTIGSAYVRSAIDFISLFRTDTTFSSKKVTIEETALGALVASEMRLARPNFKVYFPQAYLPVNDWEPEDENAVLTQLTKLYSYQEVVKTILADYTRTLAVEKEKHPYLQQIPALTALNEQVGHLLDNYENNKGEAATNRLRELLRAESLNQILNSDPKTGILQLKVLGAGGSLRTTKNLIMGSKLRHSGSAIAEYLLFDKYGALHSSEVLYHHTGFKKMETGRGSRD